MLNDVRIYISVVWFLTRFHFILVSLALSGGFFTLHCIFSWAKHVRGLDTLCAYILNSLNSDTFSHVCCSNIFKNLRGPACFPVFIPLTAALWGAQHVATSRPLL